MSKGKRSCKGRLQELRKELGISKKAYKQAGKEAASGKLPSRDKMKTFVMAESEERAREVAEERGLIENGEKVEFVVKPKDLITKRGKKKIKEEKKKTKKEKKRKKREWYFNNAWQDTDGTWYDVADGDILHYKDEMNMLSRKRRFRIAYEYLEMIQPWMKDKLLTELGNEDIMELVDYCAIQFYQIKELNYWDSQRVSMTLEEYSDILCQREYAQARIEKEWPAQADINVPGVPVTEVDTSGDVPFYYEKEYEKYCKKHPVNTEQEARTRKKMFLQKVNRNYAKTYNLPTSKRDVEKWTDDELCNLTDHQLMAACGVYGANEFLELMAKARRRMEDKLIASQDELENIINSMGDLADQPQTKSGKTLRDIVADQRKRVKSIRKKREKSIDKAIERYLRNPGVRVISDADDYKAYQLADELASDPELLSHSKYRNIFEQPDDELIPPPLEDLIGLRTFKDTGFAR